MSWISTPRRPPSAICNQSRSALHERCEAAGLPNHVKTTGKTGLHVMVPWVSKLTWEMSRGLGELLARVVMRELGDITTIIRHIRSRGTRSHLDYMQNRHGQLIVAPYAVRLLTGATVSSCRWSGRRSTTSSIPRGSLSGRPSSGCRSWVTTRLRRC